MYDNAKEYIIISKSDVTISQAFAIACLSLGFVVFTLFLVVHFSIISFILWCVFIGTSYIILFKSRRRNLYYECGKIYLSDIFHKEVYDISTFKVISRNAFSGYTIKFSDNKEYFFSLSPKDRLSLIFKADPDCYANELTRKLKDKANFQEARPNSTTKPGVA